MNTDFITQLLVRILDAFKTKSPKVWAIIAFALSVFVAVMGKADEFSVFPIGDTLKEVVYWVGWALALLLNSSTFPFKPKDENKNGQ